MRNRNRRWCFFWILMSSYHYVIICEVIEAAGLDSLRRHYDNSSSKEVRSIFSPRMDYEQWKPLGRGDPLKNDPTYDYVPPVLDRVHYWIDPSQRKPDPPLPGDQKKTEVLLLGITSKKPSTGSSAIADSRRDTYDPFLKFVDGPKFHSHQKMSRPYYSSPTTYYSQPYYTNKNRLSERNIYAKGTEQRVPYTMLIPPPLPENNVNIQQSIQKPITMQQQMSTTVKSTPQTTSTTKVAVSTTSTTTVHPPDVTVQAANLIYQSSSLSDGTGTEWKNKNYYDIVPSNEGWKSTTTSPLILTSTGKAKLENIVFQKHLLPPESYMKIEFNQNKNNLSRKPLVADGSSHNVNYVTPPPLIKSISQEVMHKGQVTDDNLDESNTYVKIGKTEAQVHSTGLDMSNMPLAPQEVFMRQPTMMHRPMMVYSHIKHPMMQNDVLPIPPLTMQTIQSMQTMQPPPMTRSPTYTKPPNPILDALEKEKISATTTLSPSTLFVTTQVPTTFEEATTTTSPPPTTTTTVLTTDPLFKHYKQPEEPIRGPLYLIIQGHSKVKTYGPSKQIHGISIQDTNEIDEKDEQREEQRFYEVKHLHGYRREPLQETSREGRSGDLQTLKHVVQTGLGSIDFSNLPAERKLDHNVKETELKVGYEVAEGKDITSEKYHKGIVEEARKLKHFENVTEH